MKKQLISEEFKRMQKLAGFQLNENEQMSEAKEDLFNKYKSKIETLRDEFIADLKSNLKDLKKLSKEDKTKLSQMIRNLTGAVDDALSEGKKVKKDKQVFESDGEMETHNFAELERWKLFSDSEFGKLRSKYYYNAPTNKEKLGNIPNITTILPNFNQSSTFNVNDELSKDFANYLQKEYGIEVEKTEKGYKLKNQEDLSIVQKDWKHFKDFIFKGIPYGKTLKDIKPPDPPSPPPPPPPTPKGKPIKLIPISSELWDSNQSAAKLGDAIKNLKQRGYSDKEIQKAIVPPKLMSQPG